MRRLFLLLPFLANFGHCWRPSLQLGGRFLNLEGDALMDRAKSYLNKSNRTIVATPLNDALHLITFKTVGNMFLSQEEMIAKLEDEGIKEGTEEFYAVLEVRRILKDFDVWIEKHGFNSFEMAADEIGLAATLRQSIRDILNKRIVCNKYTDSIQFIRQQLGDEFYEKNFKTEIMGRIESLYFPCAKMIEILKNWTNKLMKVPRQSRVGKLVRNLGFIEQPLYTILTDYAVEGDYLNTIRGEYDDEVMDAFQLYADRRTETRFLASGEFLNISSRFQTFQRAYFKTLPAEITDQFPKIYDRILEKRIQMNNTRAAAFEVVKMIPDVDTTNVREKLDYFRTIFPDANNKLVAHYSNWLQIYYELEDIEDFEQKYSVSILNEFRAVLLRYVYNSLHGVITEQQNDEEFENLVKRIEAERSKRESRNLRQLMEQAQDRKRELFKKFKAKDLIDRLHDLAIFNGSIEEKVTKYKIEFHELNSRFHDVLRLLLPILYVYEYEDVYYPRYGREMYESLFLHYLLILKKEIYKMYRVPTSQKLIEEDLDEFDKNLIDFNKKEEFTEVLKDIQKSIELDYVGQFGIVKSDESRKVTRNAKAYPVHHENQHWEKHGNGESRDWEYHHSPSTSTF